MSSTSNTPMSSLMTIGRNVFKISSIIWKHGISSSPAATANGITTPWKTRFSAAKRRRSVSWQSWRKRMRILYMADNRLGSQVLNWLKQQEQDEVVGLVIHPEGRRRCGPEMLAAAGLPREYVFDAKQLREPKTLERIRSLKADVGVSVLFGYILTRDLLSLMPHGCVNLHPAYLPYNRGAYPNVWSIVDGTPAGVTLHSIDAGIDTGPIIARREVPIDPTDTGETLYRKLE